MTADEEGPARGTGGPSRGWEVRNQAKDAGPSTGWQTGITHRSPQREDSLCLYPPLLRTTQPSCAGLPSIFKPWDHRQTLLQLSPGSIQPRLDSHLGQTQRVCDLGQRHVRLVVQREQAPVGGRQPGERRAETGLLQQGGSRGRSNLLVLALENLGLGHTPV